MSGALPRGWAETTFGDITINHDGRRVPVKASDRAARQGQYRYFGAQGVIDHIDDYLFDGTYLLIAEDGANLVSRVQPIAQIAEGRFWVNNHAHVVESINGISLKFLKHFLNGNSLNGAIRGTAQPKLNQAHLNRLRVPIPPTAEQGRIVAAIEEQFSRLDAGVAALERAQQNLKRMRAAVLEEAVSGALIDVNGDVWQEVAIGDLLDDIQAGKSFKCAERPSNPDEWGVVKVSAMTYGQFQEHENKTVVGDRTIDPRFEIHQGDLLVSRANTVEYVGAAVLVRSCRPRLLLSDKSLRLVTNSRVLPEWLLISLRASSARRYIESVATGTSDSMRNISQPKLKALKITLPPVEVQAQLVAKVDQLMSQVEQLEKSLDDNRRSVQALRSSILAAAFSGRLTAQDPTDKAASELLQWIAAERASSNGHWLTRGRKPRRLREEVTA